MEGWYLRMADVGEACMSSCTQSRQSNWTHWQMQRVGQIHPGRAVLCNPKMQLKVRPNIQARKHGFESWLCHTELTSGRNSVGHHWWGTCPDYIPQWLSETCCERGMPWEYEQLLRHFADHERKRRKKKDKRRTDQNSWSRDEEQERWDKKEKKRVKKIKAREKRKA